jgi:hypothetical protein
MGKSVWETFRCEKPVAMLALAVGADLIPLRRRMLYSYWKHALEPAFLWPTWFQ